MPTYNPEFITDSYSFSANPPVLDKIIFTIDHIHRGGPGIYSTFDVVKHLVGKQIPVTVFIQCTDPANLCALDSQNAEEVFNLNPNLVTLGVHTLTRGNSQNAQSDNLNLISNMILNITGKRPIISSYHGPMAGPENGISYSGIRYARGIHSQWSTVQVDNLLDTPVMGINSVNQSFDFIRLRNLADLSATLFVHSAELTSGSNKKKVFDTLVRAVSDRQLQALDYESAMQADYASPTTDPVITPPPQPPTTPTNPATPCL